MRHVKCKRTRKLRIKNTLIRVIWGIGQGQPEKKAGQGQQMQIYLLKNVANHCEYV